MSDSTHNSNNGKSHKNHLRKNSQSGSLKNTSEGLKVDWRNSRQFESGNVRNTQPPLCSDCGFLVSADLLPGCYTHLPWWCEIQNRNCGNTHGASLDASRTPRQFYCCHNSRQFGDNTAMNTANTHSTTATAVSEMGASPHSCSCKLLSSVLSDAITKAKTEAATGGKFGTANAYAELLQKFHAAILPDFISETKGNTSQLARLLGLDRSTVQSYAKSAGLDHLIGRQGVKS